MNPDYALVIAFFWGLVINWISEGIFLLFQFLKKKISKEEKK